MSALEADVSERMAQALDDIKEWFEDQGAPTVSTLNEGLAPEQIVQVAGTQGLLLHPELQWLYAQHDGQRELERFPLFERCSFLPLARACTEARRALLSRYFGVETLHAGLDRDRLTEVVFDPKDPLEAGELDLQWCPFAHQEADFFAAHAESGRVARFSQGDSPVGAIVAPSLDDFLCDYADALWRDVYVMSGDESIDCVSQDGLRYLGAYASLPSG